MKCNKTHLNLCSDSHSIHWWIGVTSYSSILFNMCHSYLGYLRGGVKNISGNPRLFPSTFLSKYLTGCVNHCFIVSGNHGIYVHIFIHQIDEVQISHLLLFEKCLPKLGLFVSQDRTSLFAGLAFWPFSNEHERSSSPGHGHFLCLLHGSSLS